MCTGRVGLISHPVVPLARASVCVYGDISMRLAAAVSHSSLSLSVPSAVAMAQSHPSEEERPFTYCWIGVAMAARRLSMATRDAVIQTVDISSIYGK